MWHTAVKSEERALTGIDTFAGGIAPSSADAAELCRAGPGLRRSLTFTTEEAAPRRAELRRRVFLGRGGKLPGGKRSLF